MHGTLISDLAIVLVVAATTGLVTRRLGQPSVLGYLFAGLIVGPYIPIPLFADPHRMAELAEVGVVLVMLVVGLEFRVQRLLEILPISGLTAAVQIAALAWAGFTVGTVLGWSTPACITLGATLSISSTMVVSAVIRGQPMEPDLRAHVFGVLVVQDVVAIVLMAIVTALAAGQTLGAQALVVLIGELTAVVLGLLLCGLLVLPRLVRWVIGELDSEALVVLVAAAGFGFALAAELFGYSVALGAFLAGMAIAESGKAEEVEHAVEPLRALLSALFFVSIGMSVDPLVAWTSLPLATVLCVVVIGTQLVSVTVASLLSGISLRRSILSGLALGQIGELSFIIATIAIAGDIVPKQTLPALVTVATVTAFTTPFLLKRGESIVSAVDHRLPHRAQDLLVAYQSFVRRLRRPSDGLSVSGPAIAVCLDWAALVVLGVVDLAVAPHLRVDAAWLVTLALLLVAVPFLAGLVRSGRQLALAVSERVRSGNTPAPVARVVESAAVLAAVLAAGVPTLAVLRPLVGRSWVEIALAGSLLLVSAVLASRIWGAADPHTSGVARIAKGVAERVGSPPSEDDSGGPQALMLAGLDYVPMAVPAGAGCDGQTLASLNLRSRTGATVIALYRGDETIVFPTGHEQLAAGDVLAVSGSNEALERARGLLAEATL